MLKLIFRAIFATALLSAFASGQTTTTYTGVIRDLSQNVVTSGQVTFELRPSYDSTISGFARFVPSIITCSINQASAGTSAAVRATNSVTISGLTGHTFVANDIIAVTGMTDSTFNGTFTIGSTTGTSITYPQTAGNATTGSGVIAALRSTPGPGSCTVTMNTALNPSGTSYRVCIQPNFISPGSCFNDYAVAATKDITTVVPTPTTSPAYTFVDLHSAQTIDGNKTFTGSTSFTGSLTMGAITATGLTVTGASTLANVTMGTANTLSLNSIKQQAGTAFVLADPLGVSHFFISNVSPYTNTFINGNGAGVIFLGSAAKTSVSDTTGNITMSGATSGTTTLQAAAIAGAGTLTFPGGLTDQLVSRTSTDTLTNKIATTLGITGGTTNANLRFNSSAQIVNGNTTDDGTTFSTGTLKFQGQVGVSQGSGFKHQRFGTLCTTAAGAGTSCTTAVTWTSAFADANYTLNCTGVSQTNFPSIAVESIAGAGFTIRISTSLASAATFALADCIAVHD